jgi:hypothetical protein
MLVVAGMLLLRSVRGATRWSSGGRPRFAGDGSMVSAVCVLSIWEMLD